MPEPAELDLEALTALDAAATPGPWTVGGPYMHDHEVTIASRLPCLDLTWDDEGRANAALIVAARNALPALIAEVQRLTGALATVTGQRDDALQVVADLGGAGICGTTTDGLVIGGSQLVCALRAGHAGWHRTSGGCDFTERQQEDDAMPAG